MGAIETLHCKICEECRCQAVDIPHLSVSLVDTSVPTELLIAQVQLSTIGAQVLESKVTGMFGT